MKYEREPESALQEVGGHYSGCWRYSDLLDYRKQSETLGFKWIPANVIVGWRSWGLCIIQDTAQGFIGFQHCPLYHLIYIIVIHYGMF